VRGSRPYPTCMSLLTVAAAAFTLVGCSATGRTAAITPGTPAVPEGVASQYATVNEEIREEGGETTSGEWRIGYIVEPAEPWHEFTGSGHSFRDPAPGETHHIEIVPFEKATGRIVPDVPIRLEVLDGSGKVVDARSLNFYYAEFFHYANNFAIPTPGRYTLRATLDAPKFPRHGESTDTPPLSTGVTVEFSDVELAG
jgi:hypothetical protein